jgi:hypothetical protein
MPRSQELIKKRNDYILLKFREVKKKNPKWNIIYVIKEVADDVFLTPAMVAIILKIHKEDVPANKTVAKQIKRLEAA